MRQSLLSPEINYSNIFDRSGQKTENEIMINKEIKKLRTELRDYVSEYVENRLKSKQQYFIVIFRLEQ